MKWFKTINITLQDMCIYKVYKNTDHGLTCFGNVIISILDNNWKFWRGSVLACPMLTVGKFSSYMVQMRWSYCNQQLHTFLICSKKLEIYVLINILPFLWRLSFLFLLLLLLFLEFFFILVVIPLSRHERCPFLHRLK
jgi:hypothetical protein